MNIAKILKLVFFKKRNSQDYKDVKRLEKFGKGNFKHNIHDIKNKKKYAKKFLLVHFTFKYRILVPIIALLDKFFAKVKIKKIPKSKPNYLVVVFDKAFEKALREWVKFYRHDGALNNKKKSVIDKEMNTDTIKRLRSIKEWYLTVILMDQAYKEFHNMLMLNLAKELQKECKGKTLNHLIYNSKIVDDVNYFSMFEYVRKDIKIGMHREEEKK